MNKTAPTVDYETPFKMIRTTNIKSGFVYLNDVNYVTEETFEKWSRRSTPQFGDVILTREAPVGEAGRFTSNDPTVFLGQRLFHYRHHPLKLDWNFLAYVLQSHEVQGRLRGMGFGATVHHIKVGDAENLLIPCPPIGTQRRIGDILSYQLVTTDQFVGHLVNHATGAGYPAVRPNDFERADILKSHERLLLLFHDVVEKNFRLNTTLEQQNLQLAKARDLLLPRLMNGEIAV
ncbi:MAG: restriction endonuclease subunit S [Magnetococcales bacterium]|nr:restriction endonuclease subunit S [Magnetococcales bacterium]